MKYLSALVLIAVPGCGEDARVPPEVPPSQAATYWEKKTGRGVQDCGRAQRPHGDTSCALQKVHECLHAALTECRPARGLHLSLTGEGDGIRTDYFVVPKDGACVFTVVEDRSADLLAKPPITERECRSASWAPSPEGGACQQLAPIDCGRAVRDAASPSR